VEVVDNSEQAWNIEASKAAGREQGRPWREITIRSQGGL
jgi:hypothetical protein